MGRSAQRGDLPLTPEMFRQSVDVSRETLERLILLADLLRHWQSRINLVSKASLNDAWRRHFLDSAQLVPFIPETAKILTDLGSGAGFPGLVVAILRPIEVHLIESDGRKSAFLREAARLTHTPVTIHSQRAEDIAGWKSDVVTARAVAPLTRLLTLAWPFLWPSDSDLPVCLFPKGRNWRRELTDARKMWHIRVDSVESITDPEGRVLVLRELSPNRPGEAHPR